MLGRVGQAVCASAQVGRGAGLGTVAADEAVALGLATRVCDDPLAEARSLAQAIAQRSPSAIRAAKRLLNRVADDSAAALLQAESDEQMLLMGQPQQREAVMANLERREPRFEG